MASSWRPHQVHGSVHRRRFVWCLAGVGLLCAALSARSSAVEPVASDPALGAPSLRPLTPEQALAAFTVGAGLRVELVAAEPMVVDPVALAFDEDGRLYVAEMADYPFGPPRGRIKRLEDTDGDGRLDVATRFADDVPTPLGLLPWRGGLLVAAAPDILHLTDADGDGRAEGREVWLTGFAEGNEQHRVNGLQLGLDNWLYVANGDSGGKVRRPQAPPSAALDIRGSDLRFRPDLSAIERVAGQSQFANTFDDWGRRFINSNSKHIVHPVLPLAPLARNPHLPVAALVDDVSDHGAASRVFARSDLGARFNDHHAAGHFTSACGLSVDRGGRLPLPAGAAFQAFVCEPVHNLVHRDVLEERGVSFVARRAASEASAEVLASSDPWFRPVNTAVGPDGALYVADFYRAVVEHPQWIPLEVQRRINLRAGQDKGRIWRLVPAGETTPSPRPRLGRATPPELVAALGHSNGWWRSTAQRLLVERRDRAVAPLLGRFLAARPTPLGLVHALWTLEGLGALDVPQVTLALGHADPHVREQGLRLAEPLLARAGAEGLRRMVAALAADPAVRVRFGAALALGALPAKGRVGPLARLSVRDAGDPWMRTAILAAAGGIERELLARIQGSVPRFLAEPPAGALELVAPLGAVIAARGLRAELAGWLRLVTPPPGRPLDRFRLVGLGALVTGAGGASELRAMLRQAGLASRVPEIARAALAATADDRLGAPERAAAVRLVAALEAEAASGAPSTGASTALLELLTPRQPTEVQVASARALAAWPGGALSEALWQRWPSCTVPVRRELLRGFLARPELTEALLGRLEHATIPVTDLASEQRERLLHDERPAVRERALRLFRPAPAGDLEARVAALSRRVLARQGDAVRGEQVFMNVCAPCHRRHAQGHRVGPGLESVATREPRALLLDILAPNRAIDPAYQSYVVKTPTDDAVTGIITAETATSVTLRRPLSDETTILRKDILEMKASPISMMPEGLDQALDDQALADLLALLRRGR